MDILEGLKNKDDKNELFRKWWLKPESPLLSPVR